MLGVFLFIKELNAALSFIRIRSEKVNNIKSSSKT